MSRDELREELHSRAQNPFLLSRNSFSPRAEGRIPFEQGAPPGLPHQELFGFILLIFGAGRTIPLTTFTLILLGAI